MRVLLIIAAFLFLNAMKHPFYLSVTDLKYSLTEKALQGSVKIFTNDLEASLKKKYNKTVDLINIKDSSATKKILSDYLSKHLVLMVDSKKQHLQLLGFEREEEAIWLYVEIVGLQKPSTISIENSILYEHIKEQMNIVHLEVNGEKKSYKVTFPEKEMLFKF